MISNVNNIINKIKDINKADTIFITPVIDYTITEKVDVSKFLEYYNELDKTNSDEILSNIRSITVNPSTSKDASIKAFGFNDYNKTYSFIVSEYLYALFQVEKLFEGNE